MIQYLQSRHYQIKLPAIQIHLLLWFPRSKTFWTDLLKVSIEALINGYKNNIAPSSDSQKDTIHNAESNTQNNLMNNHDINAQLEQAFGERYKQRVQYEAKIQMMEEQFQARLQKQQAQFYKHYQKREA